MPLNLRGWISLHRTFQNQLPRGQANHRAGTSGPNDVWRGWGSRGGMSDRPTPAGPILPPSPAHPDTPTLNSDPEALLDFAGRALGQASVQPTMVHLGMEQGEQLPLPSLPTS